MTLAHPPNTADDDDWADLMRRAAQADNHEPVTATSEQTPNEDRDDTPATWAPIDLTPYLDGTYTPETPAQLARTDGQHLLYTGRVHSFHGESESGKSLAAQAHAAQILKDGGSVVYIDYESDAAAVVGRLVELGAPLDTIRDRFTYIHPETAPTKREAEREAWTRLLSQRFDLAVIDGVTDALGTVGAKSNDNDEIAAWCRNIARKIARHTGAAVLLIDHVTKDPDTRGRFALGGQAKMNALDGAAYVVEVVEALGRGLRGVIALRIAKDRPGGIRAHCGTFRKLDRTQEAARIVIDSRTPGRIDVTVQPPTDFAGPTVETRFRPTHLMERVSRYLQNAGEVSLNNIRSHVMGKGKAIDEAAHCLTAEGYATERPGSRGAVLFTHVRLYTEFTDPTVQQPEDGTPEATSSPPRPHLVPAEVRRPRPRPPLPEGDEDEVGGPERDQQLGTSSRTRSTPADGCRQCGWPLDSNGHAANCSDEGKAA